MNIDIQSILLNRNEGKSLGCTQHAPKNINCCIVVAFLAERHFSGVESLTVKEIAKYMGRTPQSVSGYLRQLVEKSMVKRTPAPNWGQRIRRPAYVWSIKHS